MHWDNVYAGHRGLAFLPWHREFEKRFERDLQNAAQDPLLGLPYWDWSVDSSKTSPIWLSGSMGGNGQTSNGQVVNGPFAYKTGQWTLNVRTPEETTNYLRRQTGSDPSRSLSTPDYVVGALRATPYDVSPWDARSGSGFRNRWKDHRRPRTPDAQPRSRVGRWIDDANDLAERPRLLVAPLFHRQAVGRLAGGASRRRKLPPTSGAAPGHNLNDRSPMESGRGYRQAGKRA